MRKYTAEQKAEGVKLAQQKGVNPAAKILGMPPTTLFDWLKTAKNTSSGPVVAAEADLQQEVSDKDSEIEVAQKGSLAIVELSQPEARRTLKQRVARIYTPSQRAQALERMSEVGSVQAGRELGISRFSLNEWRRNHKRAQEQGTSDDPLAGADEDKAAGREQRVLDEWRKQPGLGPSQVRNQLRRAGFKVSVNTARRVMQEHGYVPPKVKRVESHNRRYEAVRPNQLWHLDYLQRHINKQKISVLFLVDDFSRFIPGFALSDEDRAETVVECFESSVSRHGKPEAVMSDGGAAFWAWRGVSRFTRLLEELGIDQLIAKTPQVNGKVEVLNANVQKELFNQERFFDLGESLARLRAWVSFYNFRRTHHALGGLLVPADRYFGRAQEVQAQLEAGRSAEGLGEPSALAERCLDLLRVTSRAGKVEVCLLGERLWPQTCAP